MGVERTVLKLVAGTVAMFGFAFALVPLYDVFCEITGLNGKTGDAYEYTEADLEADASRLVQIRFVTNATACRQFGPDAGGMKVNPGGINEATFHATNTTNRAWCAGIPSVAPGRAAAYFHKTQCFCFDQQVLEGRSIEMPVRFIVDRDLPAPSGRSRSRTRCSTSRTTRPGALRSPSTSVRDATDSGHGSGRCDRGPDGGRLRGDGRTPSRA